MCSGVVGNVVALLIARDDQAGLRIHADVRLPEAIAEHRRAVRPSAEMRSTLPLCLPIVVASCPPFAITNSPFGAEADRARELAHVGGLRERVGKQLVAVRLAVAVRVAEPPDAVAIEDVNLLVADRQR